MQTPITSAKACAARTEGAELIANLARDWAFARASEASTLFINRAVAATPPYMRIREPAPGCLQLESFDGQVRNHYAITEISRQRDELIFRLKRRDRAVEDVFTLYPYWDIDDTWVVIQDIHGLDEKPISFALPQHLAHRIEVMPDGYP